MSTILAVILIALIIVCVVIFGLMFLIKVQDNFQLNSLEEQNKKLRENIFKEIKYLSKHDENNHLYIMSEAIIEYLENKKDF